MKSSLLLNLVYCILLVEIIRVVLVFYLRFTSPLTTENFLHFYIRLGCNFIQSLL